MTLGFISSVHTPILVTCFPLDICNREKADTNKRSSDGKTGIEHFVVLSFECLI